MKYTKLIFTIIVFTALFIAQNVFAGCFPMKNTLLNVEATSENLNTECVSIRSSGSDCIGRYSVWIKNNCEGVLIYKDKEINNDNKKVELTEVSLWRYEEKGVPNRWDEILYYKNNPDKKITLSFSIVEKGWWDKNKDLVSKNIEYASRILAAICISAVSIYLLKKKRKRLNNDKIIKKNNEK